MADAVHYGVAQVDVWRAHVDPGAQDAGAVWKLAGLHALEKVQVFFDGPISIGAVCARFGQGAAVGADFFLAEIVDVGMAILD